MLKKTGKRVPFDRDKLARSIQIAMRKRSIDPERIERLITGIVRRLESMGESEIPSDVIGEMVMDALRNVDQVAYVRFASVYREFKDVRDFMEELEPILEQVSGLEQVRGVEAAELVGSELSSKQRPRSVPPKG